MATDENALLEAYRPSLIRVNENLTVAAFPLMKIFPAEFCVRRALEDSNLNTGGMVLETSSGTMALGLALVCNWRGLRLTVVTDTGCDVPLRRRLTDLGAQLEVVAGPCAHGGYQHARLERLREIQSRTPDAWWLNQYDNPGNSASYSRVAALITERVGRVDCLVGSVGSGGSMCGLSRYLRVLFPEMFVVGVDTFGSVLFGQPDRPRKLRGLGNSLMPRNLDHTAFNEVHWVTASEAYHATRMLHRQKSLFRGGTSGASWLVAQYWARRNQDKQVVCLLPDEGHRYAFSIYDDEVLSREGLSIESLPAEPIEITVPTETPSQWAWLRWNRRTYAAVLSAGPAKPLTTYE